jgi:hypothetical protein
LAGETDREEEHEGRKEDIEQQRRRGMNGRKKERKE